MHLCQNLHITISPFDEKEKEILGSKESYQSKFWLYIDSHYEMMKNSMIALARKKAGLPEENEVPIKSSTNPSELMNNVLKSKMVAIKDGPLSRLNSCGVYFNKFTTDRKRKCQKYSVE